MLLRLTEIVCLSTSNDRISDRISATKGVSGCSTWMVLHQDQRLRSLTFITQQCLRWSNANFFSVRCGKLSSLQTSSRLSFSFATIDLVRPSIWFGRRSTLYAISFIEEWYARGNNRELGRSDNRRVGSTETRNFIPTLVEIARPSVGGRRVVVGMGC